MLLNKFDYSEFEGENRSWTISGASFGKINLIVGKNASGKSRLLGCIDGLGKLLTLRRIPFISGTFDAEFLRIDNDKLQFKVELEDRVVKKEELKSDSIHYIKRTVDGKGKILNKDGQDVSFEIPTDELISTRQDELQYPYLKQLNDWGKNVRLFRFADRTDKTTLYTSPGTSNTSKITFDIKNTIQTLEIFKKGIDEFGSIYKERIINDLNKIGFSTDNIDIGIPTTFSLPESTLQGIKIKENDLPDFIDHFSMSDGMYRALSLIIYFNYYELKKLFGCILIDDIGEGLDYERASNLIQVIIQKVESSTIQLIMTTNNQFIMNDVSLEYWQIVTRMGNKVTVYNKNNSAKKFEEFRFTGLNNFDLFQTDFIKQNP